MGDLDYDPTLENITLTKEQDALMCQMIRHTQEAPNVLKALTRWQFWIRKVWAAGFDAGYAAGLASSEEENK